MLAVVTTLQTNDAYSYLITAAVVVVLVLGDLSIAPLLRLYASPEIKTLKLLYQCCCVLPLSPAAGFAVKCCCGIRIERLPPRNLQHIAN